MSVILDSDKILAMVKISRIFSAIAVAVLAAWFCSGQIKPEEYPALFPIQENGKYGYIDRTGKVVIEPQFEEVKEFSEGMAAVRIKDKWGYIDSTGKIAVEPKFKVVREFSEGLATVYPDKKPKWAPHVIRENGVYHLYARPGKVRPGSQMPGGNYG